MRDYNDIMQLLHIGFEYTLLDCNITIDIEDDVQLLLDGWSKHGCDGAKGTAIILVHLNDEDTFGLFLDLEDDDFPTPVCCNCGKAPIIEDGIDADACWGVLPGVLNACCGHGNPDKAYIMLDQIKPDAPANAFPAAKYVTLRGQEAINYVKEMI